MNEEIWKDIPGYEGKYQASTMGRIRSLYRKIMKTHPKTGTQYYVHVKGRVLRPGKEKDGHVSVVLGHGKPGSLVHQLVMRTFVGPPPDGMEVRHKNGNPEDNRLLNLHYGTRTENILDVYGLGRAWRKLTSEDAMEIQFGLATGVKGRELANMYHVSETTVSRIKHGRNFWWLRSAS